MPALKAILIDERDQYLAEKIRRSPGRKTVAVVGAGHVPGIKAHWGAAVDLPALEQLPPPGRWAAILKWGIPGSIVALFAAGFFYGGSQAGQDMILWSSPSSISGPPSEHWLPSRSSCECCWGGTQ